MLAFSSTTKRFRNELRLGNCGGGKVRLEVLHRGAATEELSTTWVKKWALSKTLKVFCAAYESCWAALSCLLPPEKALPGVCTLSPSSLLICPDVKAEDVLLWCQSFCSLPASFLTGLSQSVACFETSFFNSASGIQTFQCGVGAIYSDNEQAADALKMNRLDSEFRAEVVGGDAANLTRWMIDVDMSTSINILLKSPMQACFYPISKENKDNRTVLSL